MGPELQSEILLWTLILTASAAMGLWGTLKARRKLLHPGVLLFSLYFLAYCWPSLMVGLLGPLEKGMFKWSFLPPALAFTALFLCLLWCGFFWGLPVLRGFSPVEFSIKEKTIGWILPSPTIIIGISTTGLLIFLATNYYTGATLFERGAIAEAGLYDPQISFFSQIGILATLALLSPATFLAGLYWGRSRKPILFLSPLIQVFYLAAGTSRGALLPCVLFIAGAYLSSPQHRKMACYLIISGVLGLTGFVLIIQARNNGWGNMFVPLTDWEAFTSLLLSSTGGDSLSSLNYAIYFHEMGLGNMGFINWLFSMLPLPSFLGIGWTTEYYNTVSFATILNRGFRSSGWPCPVVGELYMQMGWLGAFIGIPIGVGLAKLWSILDIEDSAQISPLAIMLYMSVLLGFIGSFHSPIRACTRMPIYCILLFVILKLLGLMPPVKIEKEKSHKLKKYIFKYRNINGNITKY